MADVELILCQRCLRTFPRPEGLDPREAAQLCPACKAKASR